MQMRGQPDAKDLPDAAGRRESLCIRGLCIRVLALALEKCMRLDLSSPIALILSHSCHASIPSVDVFSIAIPSRLIPQPVPISVIT